MKKFPLRPCLALPEFWALLGTPLPPLNLILATVFWLASHLRHLSARTAASRCLNIQLTYTLIFYFPLALAFILTALDRPGKHHLDFPILFKLISGFPLGFMSLVGIVLLAFFNVRAFAHRALGTPTPDVPRARLVRESG